MNGPDLQGRARLDGRLAFRGSLVLQFEVCLDQQELQQRPCHLLAPVSVPPCPLLQVEISFGMRQGGQVEPKPVGEVDELVEPVLADCVLKDEWQADGLQGMRIDKALLDPLLVPPPQAVHDEVGLGRPGEKVIEQGHERIFGHVWPGLRHAKRRDDKDGEVQDDHILEEALGFDALRSMHRVQRDVEHGGKSSLGDQRVLDGICGGLSYRLRRLGVLLDRKGRVQARDGCRIQLLRPERSEGADEGELGFRMIPLAAPQALDVEPLAVRLRYRQQGVVQAQKLGRRDPSPIVIKV